MRHPRRGYSSVKAGLPVFITADQALRSASASSPCKKQRTTKKRQNALSLIYAGMVEMVDSEDLGAVTLVKGFCAVPRCGHSSVKAGTPVFITADQALRSASVSRRVKTEGNKIATGSPAAHIRGHDGIGRHARFRFSCSDTLGFESPCPHHIKALLMSEP